MELNSKQIGNITEVEGMLAFLKLGYNVLQPYGDCERYDFIADVKGKFYKIQCKTASSNDNGETIVFNCRSSHRKNGKCINEHYTEKDIDFFCTTWKGECYLIPVQECHTAKRLRFTIPKNGQKTGISFAEDFKLIKIIEIL